MNSHDQQCNRRNAILLGTAGVAIFFARGAAAADKLDPADPYAKSVGYVISGDMVDKAKYPKFEKNQRCDNCKLYTLSPGDFGECSFFDGALVAKAGWCKSYKPMK